MIDLNLELESLYVAYFGRPADVGGLAYWVNLLNNNPTGYQDVSNAFATSPEYRDMYVGMSNSQIVNAVYQHLFSRDAEPGGLAFWTGHLDDHSLSIDNLVSTIVDAAHNEDGAVFLAKVAAANAFTAHLDLATEQLAYSVPSNTAIAIDYLAAIKDEASGDLALDGAHIDAAIATFTPWSVTGAAAVHVVGVPAAHAEHA